MEIIKKVALLCSVLSLTLAVGAQNGSWMQGLPDTMKACRVSIPGTHDSGTAGVRFPMKHYARTQLMDLSEQWNVGIRFFDLRPKLEGGKLKIYHGPANCHITFDEALLVLKHKLEENPTDFCIVMTNSAGGGQAAVDMTMERINSVIPAGMLADFKADMTVADIRGRILFIHRNTPSSGVDYPGVVTRGWPGNGLSSQARLVSSAGESAVLWAQDFFTSGDNDKEAFLNHKWDQVYRLMAPFHDTDAGIWCINHLSGYTGIGISTNISRCSEDINTRLLDYIETHKSPIGIIPMDFPSQELIDAIIFLNTFAAE